MAFLALGPKVPTYSCTLFFVCRSRWHTPSRRLDQGWIWNLEGLPMSDSIMVSGATDSSLRVWDTRIAPGGQATVAHSDLGKPSGPIGGIGVRECGWHIVTGSFDSLLRVFDLRVASGSEGGAKTSAGTALPAAAVGLKELGVWPGHTDRVCRVVVKGDMAASTSFDTTVRVWDLARGLP